MAVSDLTNTTWVFNDNTDMPIPSNLNYNINFTSNNNSFTNINRYLYYADTQLRYNTTVAYQNDESDPQTDGYWENEAYKTITITGGTDVTNATLISWLEANATQQVVEPDVTYDLTQLDSYLVPGTSYTVTAKAVATGYADSMASNSVTYVPSEPTPSGYIAFSSPNSFTLNIVNNTKYWDGTLEYSTDTTTWNTWLGTSAISSASDGTKYNLYLRGTSNTYITGGDAGIPRGQWKLTGSDISCDGNIENLLDYATVANGNHPIMATKCYSYMFSSCTSLTTAPTLPATTLAERCYEYMFTNCSSLTTAPTLPATTLTNYCYDGMFYGCTSLTTPPPTLPATTLTVFCYENMFYNCRSLTTAPTLPATTLAERCYEYMFANCSSLTTAPTLPATTLSNYCYDQMFNGCTSLITPPALPATTLTSNCYNRMFNGCTSLTTAPALLATTLGERCYSNMFNGCTALTTVPSLPATTLTNYCYQSMFQNCTNIKLSTTQTGEYVNEYRIPATGTGTTGNSSLKNMFSSTGGTFTGTPIIDTIYYTSNTVVPQPSSYSVSITGSGGFGGTDADVFLKFDTAPTSSSDYDVFCTYPGTLYDNEYTPYSSPYNVSDKTKLYIWSDSSDGWYILNGVNVINVGTSYNTANEVTLTQNSTLVLCSQRED